MARPKGIPSHMKGKKSGRPAWNRGMKMSLETREKQRQAKLGKVGYWRNKTRPEIAGKNCYNWKGGINPINHSIRNSLEYKFWRKCVFMRDDYTCQICAERGVVLQAHHIKKFANYPHLRFDLENGITLCKKCHKEVSRKEELYEKDFYNIFQLRYYEQQQVLGLIN